MMKLFNTDQDPELPEGLIDQELSNIDSLVLKTLAFYRKHSSKYDIKRMLQDVFSVIPKYSSIKSSTIDKCIKILI